MYSLQASENKFPHSPSKCRGTSMKTLCALFVLSLSGSAFAGDAGTTSANFLKLGIGPRAIAMGEAQTGLADDVYATYWNPAGLAQLQTQEAGFVHTEYFQNISEEYAAYAHPHIGKGTLAGSFTYLNIGKFAAYDAGGQPMGNVGASDTSVALSYALPLLVETRLDSVLSVGVTGKWIQEHLDTITAKAYALDGGLLFVPGKRWGELFQGWRVGAGIRNLGTALKFDDESFTLPRSLNLGLSYTGSLVGEAVTLSMDAQQPNDGDRVYGIGLEVWALKNVALRGGYTSRGNIGNGVRAGAGIRLNLLELDYAFATGGDFGNIHRIGVTFRFGRPSTNPLVMAEDWYVRGLRDYKKGRYTDALVDFNKALEVDPNHPQAYDMMKQTYEKLKTTIPE